MNATMEEKERVFAVSAAGIVTVFDRSQNETVAADEQISSKGLSEQESVPMSFDSHV